MPDPVNWIPGYRGHAGKAVIPRIGTHQCPVPIDPVDRSGSEMKKWPTGIIPVGH
jgi:hypothetical protein